MRQLHDAITLGGPNGHNITQLHRVALWVQVSSMNPGYG